MVCARVPGGVVADGGDDELCSIEGGGSVVLDAVLPTSDSEWFVCKALGVGA